MDAEQVSLEDNFVIKISDQMKSGGLRVRNLGYGTESNEQVKMVGKVVLVSGKAVVHLGCALRVSNVSNLLVPCLCDDVINHGW